MKEFGSGVESPFRRSLSLLAVLTTFDAPGRLSPLAVFELTTGVVIKDLFPKATNWPASLRRPLRPRELAPRSQGASAGPVGGPDRLPL